MLKKLKILLIFTIVLTFMFCPLIKADNEKTDSTLDNSTEIKNEEETQVQTENAETPENYIDTNSKIEVKENDVYLFGEEITVDYAVDGNAFICAKTVNIKNKISGDLFVIAESINIEEGHVYSNVFACGNEIKINGVIYDLYALCSKIEISEKGYVYRDLHTLSETLNLYGTVGRNAIANANNFSFDKISNNNKTIAGKIYGNLHYFAQNEIQIPENIVEGKINFEKLKDSDNDNTNTLKDQIISIITSIVYTVLIYIVLMWLAPKFTNSVNEIFTKNIGPVLGIGILAMIILPIIAFALLLTEIGSSFALLLTTVYIILLAISSSIFIITLSNIIANKTNTTNKYAKIGIVAGISLVYALLKLLPFLSAFIIIVFTWLGLGIIIKQLIPKNKSES